MGDKKMPIWKLKHLKTEIDQKSDIAVYATVIMEDESGNQYSIRASSFLFDLKSIRDRAFDWIEKYFESKESANLCFECFNYHSEMGLNFSMCMVLDKGDDPTGCPSLPDEYYPV